MKGVAQLSTLVAGKHLWQVARRNTIATRRCGKVGREGRTAFNRPPLSVVT
jgi:hypothetical protein